jgi:drug/metabolite transporter (DMT)-like permease
MRYDSRQSAYLWMLGSAFAFATMGALSYGLSSRCSWQIVLLSRTTVALVVSGAIAYANNVRLVLFRPHAIWVRSIAGSIGIVCTFFAFTHLPVSDATALINTTPLWVALLSWLLAPKTLTYGILAAVVCGISGIVAIQQPHFATANAAIGLGVGSAFCVAIAMMSLNRLGEVHPLAIVVHFSALSTLTSIGLISVSGSSVEYARLTDITTLIMLLGVGVSGTLGQIAMTCAFAIGRPTGVSVVGLSQVAFAMVFDVVVWGRVFDAFTVIGIVLVVLPVSWLVWHDPKDRKDGLASGLEKTRRNAIE